MQSQLPQLRVIIRGENETLGKKIREGETQKIPYLVVIGEKEKMQGTVSPRKRGKGDLGSMKIDEFTKKIKKEVEEKSA